MRLRIAKKILFSDHWRKKKRKLRPSFIDEEGRTCYPSWHDISQVAKAFTIYKRWLKAQKGE